MTVCVNIQSVRRIFLMLFTVLFAMDAAAERSRTAEKSGDAFGDTVTACGSYTWYDSTYTASGTYSDTLKAADGITDSVVVWLYLTVLPVSYSVDSVSACDSYEWYANGEIYRDSVDTVAVIVGTDGCDSVTLHLIMHYSDTVLHDTVHICGDSIYTWSVNDSAYTESGVYGWRVPKVNSCDSVYLLTLFVHDSTHNYVYDTCRYNQLPWTYGDREYYDRVEDDIFELQDTYGCDSIVHYFLQPVWECEAYLQFPSVVTPNGDGVNDRFVISNLVEEGCYPYNRLTIYNQWGFLMYDRKNIQSDDEFWDADGAVEGTYFFRFEGYGFTDKVERHGSFEILK